MRQVIMEEYLKQPNRYELRSGKTEGAPLCPYGNHFQWIGFDKEANEYVRFSKSVFKKLIKNFSQKNLIS